MMNRHVEWHTVGRHRVSFDVRTDRSRFVVLGPAASADVSRWRPQREPIARGMIEGNGYMDGAGEPICILDVGHSDLLPTSVTAQMLEHWKAMVDRLIAATEPGASHG